MAPNKSWSRGHSKNANRKHANKSKSTGGGGSGSNAGGHAFNINDHIDSSYRQINVNDGDGKQRTVHVRTEVDEPTSARICKNMLILKQKGQFDPMNCLWTRFGIVNLPEMGSEACKFWFGVHGKIGLLRPHLPYDEIPSIRGEPDCVVTDRKYRIFLETIVIPELKSKLSESDLRTCWFQTADVLSACVFDYLRTIFGNRIICGVTHTEMSTVMDIPSFNHRPSQ